MARKTDAVALQTRSAREVCRVIIRTANGLENIKPGDIVETVAFRRRRVVTKVTPVGNTKGSAVVTCGKHADRSTDIRKVRI